MSQEKLKTENKDVENDVRPDGNTKRFKKSDILVAAVCIVASVLIWLYASNLQKNAAEKEISKEAIAEAVESGINKTTETVE